MRVLRKPQRELKWDRVELQYICGLGLKKMKKDTQGDCAIF